MRDYSKYTFRPNDKLEVSAVVLSNVNDLLRTVLEQETNLSTPARYDYVHKETSKIAPKGTKKEDLDENYVRVLSVARTLSSEPEVQYTELGKQAMAGLSLLEDVHRDNVDNDRAVLIEDLEKELNPQTKTEEPQEVVES